MLSARAYHDVYMFPVSPVSPVFSVRPWMMELCETFGLHVYGVRHKYV